MIIGQEIKVRDRRTLALVKAHLREKRERQRSSVIRSNEAFRAKWSPERLAQYIGMEVIPNAIAEKLTSLTLGAKSEESETSEKKGSPPLWKTLMAEFLEGFIPRLIQRLVK